MKLKLTLPPTAKDLEPELDINVYEEGGKVVVRAGRYYVAVFQVEDGQLKLRLPNNIADSKIAVSDEGHIELTEKYNI